MNHGPGIEVNLNRPKHACAVPGCGCQVPVDLLMCPNHWRRVGKQRRQRVWLWWKRISPINAKSNPAYPEWLERYKAAVKSAVAQAQGGAS